MEEESHQQQQPQPQDEQHQQLTRCLHQIDPILQFLTRATGHDRIQLPMIYKAIPKSLFDSGGADDSRSGGGGGGGDSTTMNDNSTCCTPSTITNHTVGGSHDDRDDNGMKQFSNGEIAFLHNVYRLCLYGILALHNNNNSNQKLQSSSPNHHTSRHGSDTSDTVIVPIRWDDPALSLGFPLFSATASTPSQRLHGSTKAAAKRRATALHQLLLVRPPKDFDHQHPTKPVQRESVEGDGVTCRSSNDNEQDNIVRCEPTTNAAAGDTEAKRNLNQMKNGYHSTNDIVGRRPGINMDGANNSNENEEITHLEDIPVEGEVPDGAFDALDRLLGFSGDRTNEMNGKDSNKQHLLTDTGTGIGTTIPFATSPIDHVTMSNRIPRQASYAGSTHAHESIYTTVSDRIMSQVPPILLQAFRIDVGGTDMFPITGQRLYSHQVTAIEAVIDDVHCSVCTGTGSGKSLCYLLPALSAAYNHNQTSLLLFPTKALAQDQLSKLLNLVAFDPELQRRIRPATLDGDTSHMARSRINECNIILTNPDILHASILPSWRTKTYQQILSSLRYVAIDEAHIYNGIFGAHVAMILRRLVRIASIASISATTDDTAKNIPTVDVRKQPTFIATSATLHNPMEHFRLLCPIGINDPIKIVSSNDDGSPRAAKHFFVWNPPVLTVDGTSTGKMHFPPKSNTLDQNLKTASIKGPTDTPEMLPSDGDKSDRRKGTKRRRSVDQRGSDDAIEESSSDVQAWTETSLANGSTSMNEHRRRHAAEETARLLARSVANGIRCIAFCKTRNLVEWVYTRTIEALKHDPATKSLVSKVESYRGGYTVTERRKIEEKLFHNSLLGVVGTNALELGIDIGGIDLTLHCGYPSSYTSLLQQAGRAGRGKDRLGTPSVAIVVCFTSPLEQQLWRRPASLLSNGPFSATSMPFQEDLVQGHLLCASEEFPLSGSCSIASIAGASVDCSGMSDRNLFGDAYDDALAFLKTSGAVVEERIPCLHEPMQTQILWKARTSHRKAWSRLSIRSIEPIQYSIVDLSHSSQRGRSDGIHDAAAVLDVIPYSRVFYHAHPGAIINHRGKKYEIVSMTQPPEFAKENYGYMRSQQLAAYVRPTTVRYLTRPLADTIVTIVKQFENVEINETVGGEAMKSPQSSHANFAGCGAVSVKRQVRGYKKLSLVNFSEIARTELTLPPIEFDTFGLFICTDQHTLSPLLGERYGPGVHALSHAILAVAPLFAMGLTRGDIECCHDFYAPSKMILFDERAGGSGCVQRIWKSFFVQNGILESAVDLLKNCSSCKSDPRYDGGCPACLHASQCSKFNTHLSRSGAIVIGERMIDRIKVTFLYNSSHCSIGCESVLPTKASLDTTPRRKARQKALQKAKEMHLSRDRQFVVSRPSWPMDGQNNRLEHA